MLLEIPNIPLPGVPDGGEDDSVVLRHVGTPPEFDFAVKDHLDLGITLDLIDMQRGAKVSGSRFAYLKGDLVLLQFALVRYGLDIIGAKGFRPVIPPVLVREEAMYGTGFFHTGRTLIAIMDNYQRADGTIAVPDVLRPLMGKGLITFST